MQTFAIASIVAVSAIASASWDVIDTTTKDVQCKTCHAAMEAINPKLTTSDTLQQMAELYFTAQDLNRPDLEAQQFWLSLQGLVLTPDYFCARTLGVCSEPKYETISLEEDITRIMADMPAEADHALDKLYAQIAADPSPRETVRFIQFADTHMDPKYLEGSTSDCGGDYCCRAESETGTGSKKAGKFGARGHRCDVSQATVEAVLDQLLTLEPDHLFWSGDNTAHDDPFVSQEEVNEELQVVVDVVKNKLSSGDWDLTVSLGNHDAFPHNQWDFNTIGPSFPGRTEFKQWIPESEYDRWDQHGYYAKDIPDLKARVLSLNTQSCDWHNQLLWNQMEDPNKQLKFIEDNLRELESKGWHAVLLGHIPNECSHQYTERFRALLNRYQNTVRFSMFGHTHSDIYQLVGSMEDSTDAVGVFQICSAITTWITRNPSFCVFELDKETLLPVARKTYFFDIEEANSAGSPNWKLETDWTVNYDLKDLSPDSMEKMADRMATDEDFTIDYINRSKRQVYDDANMERDLGVEEDLKVSSCNSTCMLKNVCETRYIDPYQYTECKGESIFDWQNDFDNSFRWAMLEPWVKEVPAEMEEILQ